MKKTTILFDLFFTLIVPKYFKNTEENEFSILGIDSTEWERLATKTYKERALGKIRDPYEMIALILQDLSISKEIIVKVTNARLRRYRQCMMKIDKDNIDTLSELKLQGHKIVAVSNVDIIDIMYWKDSVIYQYFDDSIFSYDVGIMKPE